MIQKTKKTDKSPDLEMRFSAALKTLEGYTQKNFQQPILIKIIHLARNFISPDFSDKKKALENNLEENAIQQALDDVERFLPIMRRINTEETKKLEAHALKTINACKERSKKNKNFTLHNRLQRFLKKQNPLNSSFETIKIHSLFEQQNYEIPVPKRIEDVFRMKAISLIKDRGFFHSTSHKLNTIREAPIYSKPSSEERKEESSPFTILTLEQQFSPFPGVTVIVSGSFKHDPAAISQTTPIPESFALITQSEHSGFPDPLQSHGMALSHAHIPPFPMRPERFHALIELLEKKENTAEAFLKRTLPLEKSRALSEQKILFSQKNKTTFISLHQDLSFAIFEAAPRLHNKKEAAEIIKRFFLKLNEQQCPFTFIASIYRLVNNYYIQEPFAFLQDAWLNQNNEVLFTEKAKKRLETAKNLILDRINLADGKILKIEKDYANYIKLIGGIIGRNSVNIFLQYFSEIFEFPPPQLNKFEEKLQALALHQQQFFFKELEAIPVSYTFNHLKHSIQQDIAIFKDTQPYPLCRELEKYYVNRYLRSI